MRWRVAPHPLRHPVADPVASGGSSWVWYTSFEVPPAPHASGATGWLPVATAKSLMMIEGMTGRLSSQELKQLYMARIDYHLIHGCKISPNSEDVHVKQLSKVQIRFLCQILNLHPRPAIVPLFTETEINPLRVRHLLIILNHLIYFLGLNKKDLTRAALDISLEPCAMGKTSWAKDLIKAAFRLPFHCPELVLTDAASIQGVTNYGKTVNILMQEWLQESINKNDKLYLLHGRLKPQKDKPPAHVTSKMRHYLTLVNTQLHREALTSLLLSAHRLAIPTISQCSTPSAQLSHTEFLKTVIYYRPNVALVKEFVYNPYRGESKDYDCELGYTG
ncbi:hypothetical protein B0H19DRAFT_1074172 [Mycena capillaripes]|nr:hypothetical protein B0H19DRAFT_1074172 [Mycena capillaripes]